MKGCCTQVALSLLVVSQDLLSVQDQKGDGVVWGQVFNNGPLFDIVEKNRSSAVTEKDAEKKRHDD